MEASHRSLFAVRVVRPYQTEDEFLREEAFALTAASIVLVGAGPRTDGVILRFEVVLESGAIMLRGEGRVAGYVPTPLGEGLLLRFTRLDPRSKALVDRAAPRSANDQAVIISPLSIPPPPAAPSSRPASVPPFPTRDPAEAPASVAPTAEVRPLESTPAESDPRESVLPSDRPTTEPSFAEGAPGSDRLTIESSPRECVPPSDRPTSELLERAPPPRSVAPPSVSPSRSMAATAESVAPPPESAPSRSAAPPAPAVFPGDEPSRVEAQPSPADASPVEAASDAPAVSPLEPPPEAASRAADTSPPRAPGVRSTRPADERTAALDRLRARLRGAGAAERLAQLGIQVPATKR